MDLTEKILFYMKRYHMIPENKNIVVGLSGGADSVCLLYVLAALRKKLGLQLCAVHVHHGLPLSPRASSCRAFPWRPSS